MRRCHGRPLPPAATARPCRQSPPGRGSPHARGRRRRARGWCRRRYTGRWRGCEGVGEHAHLAFASAAPLPLRLRPDRWLAIHRSALNGRSRSRCLAGVESNRYGRNEWQSTAERVTEISATNLQVASLGGVIHIAFSCRMRVLRHMVAELCLDMRTNGYVCIGDLLKLSIPSQSHTVDEIRESVKWDNKQRFSLLEDDGKLLILANQGHTVTGV